MKDMAICIKDGFMNGGKQFCIKGKKYFIEGKPDNVDEKYTLETESGSHHYMNVSFFKEYFYIPSDFIEEIKWEEFKI